MKAFASALLRHSPTERHEHFGTPGSWIRRMDSRLRLLYAHWRRDGTQYHSPRWFSTPLVAADRHFRRVIRVRLDAIRIMSTYLKGSIWSVVHQFSVERIPNDQTLWTLASHTRPSRAPSARFSPAWFLLLGPEEANMIADIVRSRSALCRLCNQ